MINDDWIFSLYVKEFISKQKVDNNDKLKDEDSYTEGSNVVFTEKYHLKRGYCCKSNCRHCPYK